MADNLLSFATGRRSPYKRFFVRQIQSMNEKGIVDSQLSRYLKEPNCKPLIIEAKPLSMKKIVALFIMLALSALLSGLLFLFERFIPVQKTNNRSLKKVDAKKSQLSIHDYLEKLGSALNDIKTKSDFRNAKEIMAGLETVIESYDS